MPEAVEAVQEQLTFGSEGERIAAMERLGDSQDSLPELERIRNAAIVERADASASPGGLSDGGTEPQPQAASVPAPTAAASVAPVSTAAAAAPEVLSLSAKALRDAGFTYGTPEDVIKGLSEKEKYIKELQEQAREKLRAGGDNAVTQKRVAELEAEIAKLRGGASQPPLSASPTQQQAMSSQIAAGSPADVKNILATVRTELASLEEEAKEDPYNRTNPEYLERQAKLLALQAQAIERISDISVQAVTSAERHEAERRAAAARVEREELHNKLRAQTFAEMDSVGNDPELSEYKLPKKSVELESEYIRWRSDVAAAYYGGAVNEPDLNKRNALEEAALHQLEVKNPDLVKKCQLNGIPAEPTHGVRSYLALLDNLAYRDGWRPDPANPGNFIRLTRYDSATGQEVPVIMPDLVTAIKQKRLEDGEYKRQVADAYQRGAQSFAAAQAKRDPAVAELNSPSTIGSSGNATQEWATQYLVDVDEEEAVRQYRAGNRTMVDEINKARAVIGLAPIENLT